MIFAVFDASHCVSPLTSVQTFVSYVIVIIIMYRVPAGTLLFQRPVTTAVGRDHKLCAGQTTSPDSVVYGSAHPQHAHFISFLEASPLISK